MSLPVRIISDIHLEFDGSYRLPKMDNEKDQILVLAGDIGLATKSYTYTPFIEDVSTRFREIIFILGNHEHYHGKFPTSLIKIRESLLDYENVNILEKETVIFDHVAFICATLWSDMGKHDPTVIMLVENGMNDYRGTIRTGPTSEPWKRRLRATDTISDHLNARYYIFEEIKKQKENGNKVVVVTHMAPCWKSVLEIYANDPVTGAYVSDLTEQMLDTEPDVWIHGHMHNSSDYLVGETRVIANPRGYMTGKGSDLNQDFDKFFTISA